MHKMHVRATEEAEKDEKAERQTTRNRQKANSVNELIIDVSDVCDNCWRHFVLKDPTTKAKMKETRHNEPPEDLDLISVLGGKDGKDYIVKMHKNMCENQNECKYTKQGYEKRDKINLHKNQYLEQVCEGSTAN